MGRESNKPKAAFRVIDIDSLLLKREASSICF
jgi:hypothetical protein